MVLAAFTGQLWYCWKHFLCYMSQDCLFNIQSKLSLVEIGREDLLIWITEKQRNIILQVHETVQVRNGPKLNG